MSLSEEIMMKLAKLREIKRLEYEGYHNTLTTELTNKTKLFCETTTQFEKAVHDYQRLFDSRYDIQEASTPNVLINSADVSASRISFHAVPPSMSQEPMIIEGDNDFQPAEKPSLSSIIRPSESSISINHSKSTLEEDTEKARLECQNVQKRYKSLETSIIQARNRIEAARKEYYKALVQFDKLEKDLLSVSSAFESQKRIDIENNLKKLEEPTPYKQSLLSKKTNPSTTSNVLRTATNPPQISGVKRKISSLECDVSDSNHLVLPRPPPFKRNVVIAPRRQSQKATVIISGVLVTPILLMLAPALLHAIQKLY